MREQLQNSTMNLTYLGIVSCKVGLLFAGKYRMRLLKCTVSALELDNHCRTQAHKI